MHEISIIEGLMDMIREELTAHGVSRLTKVTVRYGALNMIVPELMQSAFRAAVKGTLYEDAVLELEAVPIVLACADCNRQFSPGEGVYWADAACPHCGCHEGHLVMNGDELTLTHLEAE